MRRLTWILLLLTSACIQGGGGTGADAGNAFGDGGTAEDGGSTTSDGAPCDDCEPGDAGTTSASAVGAVTLSRTLSIVGGEAYETSGASASFYDPYQGTGPALPGLDECYMPSAGGGQATVPTPRDAGAQVLVTPSGPGPTLVLARQLQGSSLYYDAATLATDAVSFDADYSVSWPGSNDMPSLSVSAAQGLHVPQAVLGLMPMPGASVSGSLSVAWTGEMGASESLWMTISGYDAAVQTTVSVTCQVRDDGNFTLGSSWFAQLPSGTVSIALSRYQSRPVDVGADEVVYLGGFVMHYWQVTKD